MKYLATVNGNDYALDVQPLGLTGACTVTLDGHAYAIDLEPTARGWLYSLLLDGRSYQVAAADGGIDIDGRFFAVEVERDLGLGRSAGAAAAAGPARLTAPIPGLVVTVHVKPGEEVHEGQPLVVVEAMKMQMELKSPRSGHIAEIGVAPGQEVVQGQVLAVIAD